MTEPCKGCGHPMSRHFLDVTNVVRCLVIESSESRSGIIGLRGEWLCDCADYHSSQTDLRRAVKKAEDDRRQRAIDELVEAVKNAPPVDRTALCTTSGEPPEKVRAEQTEETGQHKGYIVLCEDERKKGFVRPYRDRYTHVGRLETLMDGTNGTERIGGCGTVTTMGRALSETYARDPGFYGATFCVHCNRHLPVAEFTWTADGQRVGS